MSAARIVLERLLRRAESARLRGAGERVSLLMGSVGEYVGLRSIAELETFHAEIALAEREGAIIAKRERRSGDGSRLLRLTVATLQELAHHLGVQLLDQALDEATNRLHTWVSRFPVLDDALDVWRKGRKVRGCGPEAAENLMLASMAVAEQENDGGHERILRRESVRLFGDSKRLEKLTPWLEILVTGELVTSGLSKEEVWSAIGLRREPQPLLLAGRGTVELLDATLPLVQPYLGVPLESLQGLATRAGYLLTIENLASFHDSTKADGAESVLMIYTGGMPSPAWRAAYSRILRCMSDHSKVYHWGDIDVGGFRIAAALAKVAHGIGHQLLPWQMSPDDVPVTIAEQRERPSSTTSAEMARWALRAGWQTLAELLQRCPITLEQEALDPNLDRMTSRV